MELKKKGPMILTICRSSLIFLFLLFFVNLSFAQALLYEAGTETDASLAQWYLVSDLEEDGVLETKWKLKKNYKEWTYSMGEKSGDIKLKWDAEPIRWELRSDDGVVVQMVQSWRDDITEWKVECEGIELKYEMPQKNDKCFWTAEDPEFGYFECITVYERDFRDWEIFDELSEEITFEMKLSMFFISIYSHLPSVN